MQSQSAPLRLITHVFHACVRLESEEGIVVYTDPLKIKGQPEDADIIVITHQHGDHFSPEDIRKVMKEGTNFVTTEQVADMLMENEELDIGSEYITVVSVEDPAVYFENGVAVTPVVAENKNHPIGTGFGAIIEIDEHRYYVSGDTDRLASDLNPVDVLFVVCDGKYNMPNYETRVIEEIRKMDNPPDLVVPFHYGYIEGTAENGKILAAALTEAGIPNKLLYEA